MNHPCTARTEGYCSQCSAVSARAVDVDPIADFLTRRDGDGITPEQYDAMLTETEAHRMNRQIDQRRGEAA